MQVWLEYIKQVCRGSIQKANFYNLSHVVTLKIESSSSKFKQVFYPSQLYNQPSFVWTHQLVHKIRCRQAFLVKIWHSYVPCDLENKVKATKIQSFISPTPLMYPYEFGQNPSISSQDREQTRTKLCLSQQQCWRKQTGVPQETISPSPLLVGRGRGHKLISLLIHRAMCNII